MKIKVIIIGLGKIAHTYDEAIIPSNGKPKSSLGYAFMDDAKFELVAGIDPDEKARERFLIGLDVPTYPNLQDIPPSLLQSVNAFVITAPTSVHISILSSLLTLKEDPWILCEKPMGISLQEVEALEELINTQRVLINYSRRFSEDIAICEKQFKSLIQDSFQMPPVLTCQVFGGILRTGSHFLDLFSYWFGLDPNRLENMTFLQSTPMGMLLNFNQVKVLYQDIDPAAEESYAVVTLECGDQSLSLIRDRLILKQGHNENYTDVVVDQAATIDAFYELITSNGKINRCSFDEAKNVHRMIDSIRLSR
jgi:predicted dehydrogenase